MSRSEPHHPDPVVGRRFLAVDVPGPTRAAIAAATAHLRHEDAHLRATSPDSWHVTLAFLGAVDDDAADRAVAVLRTCLAEVAPRPAPRLSVAGADRFGDRVLVLALAEDPPGALAGVVATLHTRLRQVGFALPGRRFRAHLTVARARGRARVRAADVRRIDPPEAHWRPDGVGLWTTARTPRDGAYEIETEVAWPAPR